MAHPGGDGTWPPPDSNGSGHDQHGPRRPEDLIGPDPHGHDHDGRRRTGAVVRFVVLMALAGVITFALFALYYDGRLGADPAGAAGSRTALCEPTKPLETPNNLDATPSSTDPPTVTASATDPSSSTPTNPSAGVGGAVGQAGGIDLGPATVIDAQISVTDLTRGYRLHLPATYDGRKPMPLVVLLAGTGGTIDSIESYTGLPEVAVARGYAVVTPAQVTSTDGQPSHWTVPGQSGPSDVAFVQSLVTSLEATYCLDPQRVYATGMAAGAGFATYLACQTTMFAAIAPVSGLNLIRKCDGPPEPVLTFHGTSDNTVSYSGVEDQYTVNGQVTNPDTYYNGSIDTAVKGWADRDECKSTSSARLEPDVTVISYTNCRDNSVVVFYSIQGGGDAWPGLGDATASDSGGIGTGEPVQVEHSTTTIRANDVMLDFFDNHVKTS